MAIIRKGDVEAEKALADTASNVRDWGKGITPGEQAARTRKRKAARDVKINPKTGRATDKSPRYRDKEYKGGGISGAAIARARAGETTVRNNPSLFSGIIQSGKLVKGGNGPLGRSLDWKASRKQQEFESGHDGAKA